MCMTPHMANYVILKYTHLISRACVGETHGDQKKTLDSFGARVTGSFAQCGCWESKLGLLQEQQSLLKAEPSPQLWAYGFSILYSIHMFYHTVWLSYVETSFHLRGISHAVYGMNSVLVMMHDTKVTGDQYENRQEAYTKPESLNSKSNDRLQRQTCGPVIFQKVNLKLER